MLTLSFTGEKSFHIYKQTIRRLWIFCCLADMYLKQHLSKLTHIKRQQQLTALMCTTQQVHRNSGEEESAEEDEYQMTETH